MNYSIKDARVLPLEGKYYGTKVEITYKDGAEVIVEFWDKDVFDPSDRELEANGFTRKQWEDKDDECMHYFAELSSHYESKSDYIKAVTLVEAIKFAIHG